MPPLLAGPDDSIEYTVGDGRHHPRTAVLVEGDGQTLVRWQQGEREDSYRGELADEELVAFRAAVTANDPRRLASGRRYGVPGEARIRLVTHAAGQRHEVELWDNERRELPALKSLVVAFNRVASLVSGGKVTY